MPATPEYCVRDTRSNALHEFVLRIRSALAKRIRNRQLGICINRCSNPNIALALLHSYGGVFFTFDPRTPKLRRKGEHGNSGRGRHGMQRPRNQVFE
jgi:hypothetical protein